LTTEFIAGLVNHPLDEEQWQYQSAVTESDWAKLTMKLRRTSRARWRSTPVRTPAGQTTYKLQARALEDGRKLAARLCAARKAIPNQCAEHEQRGEVVERFTQDLTDAAIGAVATYPSHLRCWLTSELLGGFIAALLPQNSPDGNIDDARSIDRTKGRGNAEGA